MKIKLTDYRTMTKAAQRMNKWEKAYAQKLQGLLLAGKIAHFSYESSKLRLADATWYTPDFKVITIDDNGLYALEYHEVKGHWEDDARVKFKVAADLHPEATFVAVTVQGGNFVQTERL